MMVYGVFAFFSDHNECLIDTYETLNEAIRCMDYLRSLPPALRMGEDLSVAGIEVSKEFKPYFPEAEVERAWHFDDVANDYASREP